MNIEFTNEEKIQFLQRKGYTVLKGFKEVEDKIHGSKFTCRRLIVWMAYKNGKGKEMDVVFYNEIKSKILK